MEKCRLQAYNAWPLTATTLQRWVSIFASHLESHFVKVRCKSIYCVVYPSTRCVRRQLHNMFFVNSSTVVLGHYLRSVCLGSWDKQRQNSVADQTLGLHWNTHLVLLTVGQNWATVAGIATKCTLSFHQFFQNATTFCLAILTISEHAHSASKARRPLAGHAVCTWLIKCVQEAVPWGGCTTTEWQPTLDNTQRGLEKHHVDQCTMLLTHIAFKSQQTQPSSTETAEMLCTQVFKPSPRCSVHWHAQHCVPPQIPSRTTAHSGLSVWSPPWGGSPWNPPSSLCCHSAHQPAQSWCEHPHLHLSVWANEMHYIPCSGMKSWLMSLPSSKSTEWVRIRKCSPLCDSWWETTC